MERVARAFPWRRVAVAVLVVAAIALARVYFPDSWRLTAENAQELARREAVVREFHSRHPLLIYAAAFLLYVVVTVTSIPGAAVGLSLVYGWYFRWWRAVLLVSFASTTGATCVFLLSRYLLRDSVGARLAARFPRLHASLEREGASYLFYLRLVPAVPFTGLNLLAGVTPLSTRAYWLASQLGMLPGTMLYVHAGANVPDLDTLARQGVTGIMTPQLFGALLLLGLCPLLFGRLARLWWKRTEAPASEP